MKTIKLNNCYLIGFAGTGLFLFATGVVGFMSLTKNHLIFQMVLTILAMMCGVIALVLKKKNNDEVPKEKFYKSFFYAAIMFVLGIVSVDLIDLFSSIMISDNFQLLCLAGGPASVFIGIYCYYITMVK